MQRGIALAATAAVTASLCSIGSVAHAAPVDGAPSIGDSLFAGIGNTGYDVSHYDVELEYFHQSEGDHPAKSIVATTTITAVATAELRSFTLDFEGLTVDRVLVNGVEAAHERWSDKPSEAFKLRVTPATPVSGEFKVQVDYSGVPVRHTDNDGSPEGWVATADGTTALGQPVGTMAWIPSNNTPADKATFDFRITIPSSINGKPAAAASNGELLSRVPSEDGSKETWTWQQREQQATMSTILSIGNFHVREGSVTLRDGRTIPEWSFLDMNRTPQQIAAMDHRRSQLENIHQTFEGLFGPYPGNSTGVVVDVNPVGYALETQDRSFFPGSIGERTLAHEIAHQWYGAAVSPSDWGSIWISEGMGTWGPEYWYEKNGTGTTAEYFFSRWQSMADDHELWSVPPGAMTEQDHLYGNWSYTRAGMMYEALRQVFGEELFHTAIRGYVQDNNGKSRSGAEFKEYMETVSGKDLDAFFDNWIYGVGKPKWPSVWHYTVSAAQEPSELKVGDTIAYELTATNAGQVDLQDGAVSVDLADVLDDATIGELDPSLTLDGTTLTWMVPQTSGTDQASVRFEVTVKERAFGATLGLATDASLGAFCEGNCDLTHVVAPAPPVTESDLTEDTRGTVSLPDEAFRGDDIEVHLGADGAFDGTDVDALLFSTPMPLGSARVASGAFTVTIPANAPLGAHRLAVLDAQGVLIGWDTITILERSQGGAVPVPLELNGGRPGSSADRVGTGPQQLSNTGADHGLLFGIAAGFLTLGAGVLMTRRSRGERGTRTVE